MKRSYYKWKAADMKAIHDNPLLTDEQVGKLIGLSKWQVKSFRKRQRIIKCQKTFSLIGAAMVRKNKAA